MTGRRMNTVKKCPICGSFLDYVEEEDDEGYDCYYYCNNCNRSLSEREMHLEIYGGKGEVI